MTACSTDSFHTAAIEYGGRSDVRMPPEVKAFYRDRATCAECRQRIHHPTLPMAVRGVKIFHPGCAVRYDARAQRSTPVASAPNRVLARITGVALPFNQRCLIVDQDGTSESELFRFGVFGASIPASGVRLAVGHGAIPLKGSFARIWENAGALTFHFKLEDGPQERRVLSQIRNGEMTGCSIGFRPGQGARVGMTLEHICATLTEISLCVAPSKPAWYGAHVAVLEG